MLRIAANLDQSAISGIGLFAAQNIQGGALVWEFVAGFDLEIEWDRFSSLPALTRDFLRHYGNLIEPTHCPGAKAYLLCGDNARFMNHSDNPNISASSDQNWALRDIAAGEELTCNYREFDLAFAGFEGALVKGARSGF